MSLHATSPSSDAAGEKQFRFDSASRPVVEDLDLRKHLAEAEGLIWKHSRPSSLTREGVDRPTIDVEVGSPRVDLSDRSSRYRPHVRSADAERPWLAWTFLSLGIMAFACGSALSATSFLAGHGRLWHVGLPLVLVGQAGLLLGLVLQIDGIWMTNQRTSRALDQLDDHLTDLKKATYHLRGPAPPREKFERSSTVT